MTSSLAKFEEWITEDPNARFNDDEHIFYLSGPMSGKPDSNFSLFQQAAEILRERGFYIISPVELDLEEESSSSPWGHYIGRDVHVLIDKCDAIILLPDWQMSKGARIELFVAITCGHALFEYADAEEWLPLVVPLNPSWAMEILRSNTLATSPVL